MLSFIIIALFARPPRENDASLKFNLLKSQIGKFLVHPIIIGLIRFVFTALFILIIAAGFWGSQNPLNNISIVMVWVIAWVGLAFICSLLGNFWALINPWNTIFLYIEKGYRKITGNNLSRHNKYPIKYGYLPSFVFFFCFAWLEINWSGSNTPSSVATALLVYSVFTFVGMWVYGRETWLKYGECFTVVYSLFSRFSITEGRINSEKPEWFLRPPGIGLLREDKNLPEPTLVYFILLLLSTVTYDGFTETETFQQISLSYIEFAKDLTGKEIDAFAQTFFDTVALLSFPIVFILTYGFFIWLSAFMDEETKRTLELARVFIFSIVPISIAYHLSHYISSFSYRRTTCYSTDIRPFWLWVEFIQYVSLSNRYNNHNRKICMVFLHYPYCYRTHHCRLCCPYGGTADLRRSFPRAIRNLNQSNSYDCFDDWLYHAQSLDYRTTNCKLISFIFL